MQERRRMKALFLSLLLSASGLAHDGRLTTELLSATLTQPVRYLYVIEKGGLNLLEYTSTSNTFGLSIPPEHLIFESETEAQAELKKIQDMKKGEGIHPRHWRHVPSEPMRVQAVGEANLNPENAEDPRVQECLRRQLEELQLALRNAPGHVSQAHVRVIMDWTFNRYALEMMNGIREDVTLSDSGKLTLTLLTKTSLREFACSPMKSERISRAILAQSAQHAEEKKRKQEQEALKVAVQDRAAQVREWIETLLMSSGKSEGPAHSENVRKPLIDSAVTSGVPGHDPVALKSAR